MLSIGKLGPGHAHYYEQSVADGREDYYTGKGEEQGTYVGEGADALNLSGELAHGDLPRLLRGQHPTTKQRWLQRQQQAKTKPRTLTLADGTVIHRKAAEPTAAFDLTFSAPKSVSVLWGLSDGMVAADVKQAHVAAVREAFDYLERVACVTRRGKGGKQHVRGEGFVGAAYTHRTSRAGDPQLHTHVIIANATLATSRDRLGRSQTRYTALHGTLLYREAKTASYLYHAALRRELNQRLGVKFTKVEQGIAEIDGIDADLRKAFSKRSGEIAQQLALAGHTGARAANAAAIDTRAAKTYDVDAAHLKTRWLDEARTLDAPDVLDAIGRTTTPPDDTPNASAAELADELAHKLFAPTGLTQHDTTFARRDVIRAVAATSSSLTTAQIEARADLILDRSAHLIQKLGATDPAPIGTPRTASGAEITDGRVHAPYSTRELLEAEHTIIDTMRERRHDGAAKLNHGYVTHTLTKTRGAHQLAPDQRYMVERITTSGAGVEAIVGIGGSGKTTSLAAAHQLWTQAGIEVRGCAIADQAARNLEAETGIPSRTIRTLQLWMNPNEGFTAQPDKAYPPGGVLVVDEAGMVPTRELAEIARGCAEAGTKLVLIGDHRQLPEIEAGGSFKAIVHRFEPERRVLRLLKNRRQHHAWERDALAQLRSGKLDKGIATYADQGRVHPGTDPLELRRKLVNDWLTARQHNPEVAIITYTRADTAILNQLARQALDDAGHLGRARHVFAEREFAVGDEVMCLSNKRALGISNGTRGHVTALGASAMQITTPTGDSITIPRDYLTDGYVAHAYAATGHKSQGRTIHGDAFVLASQHINREWLYVALSRARNESHIYIDVPERNHETGKPLTPIEQQHHAILTLHELATRTEAHTPAMEHYASAQLTPQDLERLAQRDDLTASQRTKLETERSRRDGQLRDRISSNPPSYLRDVIGEQPLDPAKRERWIRDAVRLEKHRQRNDLKPSDMSQDRSQQVLGRRQRRGPARGR